MTIASMKADMEYIKKNTGSIPDAIMCELYEKYMNGADKYLLGVEYKGKVYGVFSDHLDLRYCSCQTDHKTNNQYFRFRPHQWGAKEIAENPAAIDFGDVTSMYTMYQCKNKQGFNSGYCFEKHAYNRFDIPEWEQDNKPCYKGGDMVLNGEEIQLKYARKNSLATITSTSKILKRIAKLLQEAA